ncbi:MAG TPA: hypothetical protein VMU25_02640 [Candidatus Paceibacterota bacterium]|nr:hypothetical protein [Candidatus Paceibacterota bacterium]
MSNLLPPQSQKHMRIEYRARFLLVAALVILGCAALALLALVPAEIAVVKLPSPEATSTQSTTDAKADRAVLAQAQGLLHILGPIAATPSFDPIADVLSERGSGITIRALSYSIANHTIVLLGSADSPDHLNAFRAVLQADSHFSNVSVPVNALLGTEQNGGFTISMKVQS